jgi:hypothetical protein
VNDPQDTELAFADALALSDEAALALEDYARVLARAAGAEVIRAPAGAAEGRVAGVRLAGARATPEARADIEAFAHGLARGEGGGLGWS